jgi:hypothetical protein
MLHGSPHEQERLRREDDLRAFAEQLDKLFLLLDHFGIPRANRLRWFQLALGLSRQHVPGMRVVEGSTPKRGPKGQRRGTPSDHEFLIALTEIKLQRKRGTQDAIRILRKRQPHIWGRFTEKSLEHRYSKLRSELVPYRTGDLIDNLGALLGFPARAKTPRNYEK